MDMSVVEVEDETVGLWTEDGGEEEVELRKRGRGKNRKLHCDCR